jgi:dihydroflavonol-4-reductase
MKALVTGATGFIGGNLATALLHQGHQVYCLARSAEKARHLQQAGGIIIVDELLAPQRLATYLSDIDIIFHLAGVIKGAGREDYMQGNYLTTRNLVQLINHHSPAHQKVIYISSQAAAGPSADPNFSELDPAAQPVSAYGESKLAAENEILSMSKSRFVVILRPSIVFGPGDRALLPFFQAAKWGLVPRPGIREMAVNFIYIKDLINAILLASEKQEANSKIFFVNDGTRYSWRIWNSTLAENLNPRAISLPLAKFVLWAGCRLGQLFTELTGITTFFNADKWQEMKHPAWLCSSASIRKDLGFVPLWSLQKGIQETIVWYKQAGWLAK